MNPVTPESWARQLSAPPVLDLDHLGCRAGGLRRWRGTAVAMSQPSLDHHYIVLHLGGPKRVTRTGEGRVLAKDVHEGAVTIVPAGTSYEWRTEGPIDFAHLYIHPARLNHAVAALFDGDPTRVTLAARIGANEPLIRQVICAMLAAANDVERGRPYLDALFDVVLAHLVRAHTVPGSSSTSTLQALAPARLRRVLDFIESELSEPISLQALAGVAGVSRFHFSRAFRETMSQPPLAYVAQRRVEAAKRLLRETELPLGGVARQSGFGSPSHLAVRFRRHTGMTPSQYRWRL